MGADTKLVFLRDGFLLFNYKVSVSRDGFLLPFAK